MGSREHHTCRCFCASLVTVLLWKAKRQVAGKLTALHDRFHDHRIVYWAVQVLNASPQNYEALLRLARLWMKVKRPANALKLAKSAAEHYPKNVEARELLAECLG